MMEALLYWYCIVVYAMVSRYMTSTFTDLWFMTSTFIDLWLLVDIVLDAVSSVFQPFVWLILWSHSCTCAHTPKLPAVFAMCVLHVVSKFCSVVTYSTKFVYICSCMHTSFCLWCYIYFLCMSSLMLSQNHNYKYTFTFKSYPHKWLPVCTVSIYKSLDLFSSSFFDWFTNMKFLGSLNTLRQECIRTRCALGW